MDGPPQLPRSPFPTGTHLVHRLAEDVQDAPEYATSPTGTVIGRAGILDVHATCDAVRGGHRHRAHLASAMCCCTSATRLMAWPPSSRRLQAQRVVDIRHVLGIELHVQHRSDDPDDLSECFFSHGSRLYPIGGPRLLERSRAADDFGDLLGDLALTGPVVGCG